MTFSRIAAACVVAGLLSAACTLADPSNAHTDTFSGALQLGGKDVFSFSVGSNGGEVSIKFTSIAPDSGIALGVAYGTLASGSTTQCLPISQVAAGTQGRTAITNTITQGTFCLVVFDSGFMQRAESYTVTVSHP